MTIAPTPIAACSVAEVPEGTALRVELDDEPIAIVHTQGEWFAILDVCSHAEVPLSEGEIDGCTLECWLHGSRFDLLTGDPSGPPATVPVAVHHVTIEGDDVYVALKEN